MREDWPSDAQRVEREEGNQTRAGMLSPRSFCELTLRHFSDGNQPTGGYRVVFADPPR